MPFGVSSLQIGSRPSLLSRSPPPALRRRLISWPTSTAGRCCSRTTRPRPGIPASTTKLMTVYVALDAVRAGRLTMDTPLVVSARAASQQPSKMGFRPGTEVTLDNALKMLMVKSPNDVAVTVAEGVSGSVEAFAGEMNAAAQKLGLHESHFVNPNGLHNPAHVSSARDMAMIARALLKEFPERGRALLIGALQLDSADHPQPQRPARPLSRRRRDEDRLHLCGRVQRGRERQPFRAPPDHGRARRAFGEAAQPGGGRPLRPRLRHGRRIGVARARCRPAAATRPNMRSNVCLHRSAAAIAAEEDDGGGEQEVIRVGRSRRRRRRGRRGLGRADPHDALRRTAAVRSGAGVRRPGRRLERPGPRPAPDARSPRSPADAKAYAGDKPDAIEAATAPGGPNAPQALEGAVRTPAGRQASRKGGEARRFGRQDVKPAAEAEAGAGARKSRAGPRPESGRGDQGASRRTAAETLDRSVERRSSWTCGD